MNMDDALDIRIELDDYRDPPSSPPPVTNFLMYIRTLIEDGNLENLILGRFLEMPTWHDYHSPDWPD